MAEATPTESLDEIHKKLAHYVETKRYIEEPEVLPWYKKNLDEIKPRTRELFEKYSHIAPAALIVSRLAEHNTETAR
jgi:hypothetical protein